MRFNAPYVFVVGRIVPKSWAMSKFHKGFVVLNPKFPDDASLILSIFHAPKDMNPLFTFQRYESSPLVYARNPSVPVEFLIRSDESVPDEYISSVLSAPYEVGLAVPKPTFPFSRIAIFMAQAV